MMDELAVLRIILRLENSLHATEQALAAKTAECAQAIARTDQVTGTAE